MANALMFSISATNQGSDNPGTSQDKPGVVIFNSPHKYFQSKPITHPSVGNQAQTVREEAEINSGNTGNHPRNRKTALPIVVF
ncbi:MAG: hypothetical protein NT140_11215 [Deltaproteobacteria bacterium]|nr:hypothetical protein [Deltaproteobacteria bacterium]